MTISGGEYKFISDNLGDAKSLGLNIAQTVGLMYATLINNDTPDELTEKQILRRAIDETYILLFEEHVDISPQLSAAVESLQEHILHRYETIDSFLEDVNIKVSQAFANLSEQLGYEIDSMNIE